jgi:uncharacterized protein YegL
MESLEKTVKISSMIKRVGINGIRADAKAALAVVKPEEVPNRYAIGFDDSGSMGEEGIKDAHKAIAGFLAACSPLETSVAIYPYNREAKPLTNMFDVVNAYVAGIKATGGTPLWGILGKMLRESKLTRGIIFSDGGATDEEGDEINYAREHSIKIDTVFIGHGSDNAVLQRIAECTGGVYLKFDSTTTFGKQLKYLSPKYVALLANADLKARIERGEQI